MIRPRAAAFRTAALALGLAALAGFARPARASVEEFSSFDVTRMEEDDENALDHMELRTPIAWRDEWERAEGGFRTTQGCFTSGVWYMANDFHARSPLSDHAWLNVNYLERADDQESYRWLNLDFWHGAGRAGDFGFRFRPAFDKSQQDFAALWRGGSATSRVQADAAFTVEDAFNSLWEFRQIRVGNRGEPYRSHPFEPAAHVIVRGRTHRLEASATWLTPSRKRILDPDPALDGSFSLWGSKASLVDELTVHGWTLETRGTMEQVRSLTETTAVPGDGAVFRRLWHAEAGLRHAFSPRWRAEAHVQYQARTQTWRPPVADARFDAIDRMKWAEVDWDPKENWTLRMGIIHDRIGIERRGLIPDFTWGTRKESRAFLGLQARFGRIRVQGIEGIELDQEPYEVSFHHDKGFLQLQTAF